jgi:hypothetical protein
MRLVGPLRLAGALVVTAAVLVTALAAGQQLTQRRSQSQQETDVQSFAPPPVGAAGAALAVPVRCDGPVLNTSGDRFAEPVWSPDSTVLAASRPSADGAGSRISLLYGSDWTAHDIADGRGPRWSASGEMLAFEAEKPGTLRVVNVRTGKQLASIASTSNAYAWRGDILLFWRGAELRAWQGGSDSLRFEIAPEYSSARGYEPSFSGDASRFVVVRRDGGKIAGLLLGDTDDGRVSPQDVPVSYSWAPVGRRLLLQYSDRASLFSEAKQSAAMGKSELPGAFTAWSSDGLRALFGSSSSSALLGWDGRRIDPVANVDTTGAETLLFTPDSRTLAALETSGALKIRDCADALGNDPRIKITRDQAIALVRQRPDVISVGWKIEAKLVVWAEIKRNLSRFQVTNGATIDPGTPVWVVGLSGEVRRPPSWNPQGAQPTYPLGLFILDAADGHEIAMMVTIGTWWIGDGFDDLNEYGALPPATTPPPGAFAKPVTPVDYTVTPVGSSQRVESPAGWSIDVPKHWWLSGTYGRYGGAVISNYDPDYGSTTNVMSWATRDRVRLTLETWTNEQRRSVDAWVDDGFKSGVSQRNSALLGGQPAQVFTQYRNFGPPPNGDQTSRFWVVSTGPITMLVISAFPADSTKLADVERILDSLRLSAVAAPSPATLTRADAIRIATDKVTISPTGKPTQVRVDRAEAKLVRSVEASQIIGPFSGTSSAPLGAAPDDPVWIVALAGDLGDTSAFRCGPIGCPVQTIHSSITVIDARTGQVRGGPSGTALWPVIFDALPDRS